jgi:hypothetical protein
MHLFSCELTGFDKNVLCLVVERKCDGGSGCVERVFKFGCTTIKLTPSQPYVMNA